ncbi:hypothetical protein [Kribbella sp. CA-247076]|uniref:hypothetical protein n=1 Tax=Kribbella sp. CA-247076 TaxID=3239941 RepID=UPI003D912CD9
MLGAVLLGLALMLMPAGAQAADPSPSPTLGSTASPNANPPGAQDGDANDYRGVTWVVIGAGIVVVLVAGGSYLLFRNRSRTPPADRPTTGRRATDRRRITG